MIHKPKNTAAMIEHIKHHKPKLVVFAGRHEPLEPSYRFLMEKDGDQRFHERFDNPSEVMLIKLPRDYTPIFFGARAFPQVQESIASIARAGESIPGLTARDTQAVSKAISRVNERIASGRYCLDYALGEAAGSNLPRRARSQVKAVLKQAYADLGGAFSREAFSERVAQLSSSHPDKEVRRRLGILSDSIGKSILYEPKFGREFDAALTRNLTAIRPSTRQRMYSSLTDYIRGFYDVPNEDALHKAVTEVSPGTRQLNLHFSSHEAPHNIVHSRDHTTIELAGAVERFSRKNVNSDKALDARHLYNWAGFMARSLGEDRMKSSQMGKEYTTVTTKQHKPFTEANRQHFIETVQSMIS